MRQFTARHLLSACVACAITFNCAQVAKAEVSDDPQAVVKTYNETMDAFIHDSGMLSIKLGSVKTAKEYDDKELRKQISSLISGLSDKLDLIESIEASGATKSFDSMVKKEEFQAAIADIQKQYMKRFEGPRVLEEMYSKATITKDGKTKDILTISSTVSFSFMPQKIKNAFASVYSYSDIICQEFYWNAPRRRSFEDEFDALKDGVDLAPMREDPPYKKLNSMGKNTVVTFGFSTTNGYQANLMSKYAQMIWRQEIAKTQRIKNWKSRMEEVAGQKFSDDMWNFKLDGTDLSILHSMPVPDDKDAGAAFQKAKDICDKKIAGFTDLVKKCYGTKTVDQMIDERTSQIITSGDMKDLFKDPKEREELKSKINALVAKLQQDSDLSEAEKVELLNKEVFNSVRPKIAEQVKKEVGDSKKDEKPVNIKENPFFEDTNEVVKEGN